MSEFAVKLTERIGRMTDAGFLALQREMDAIGIYLVGKVRENLAGPVLNQRSGRLMRAMKYRTLGTADSVAVTLGDLDGRVPYAGIHERGGSVKIPERTGGSVMRFTAKSGDLVFTRSRRAYTIPIKERSYLSRTLLENEAIVRARIQGSVQGGVQNANN